MEHRSFSDICIVSCGTLKPEVDTLRKEGFLDAKKVLFTAPGLHEWPRELEKQLVKQLETAKRFSEKTIVLYGERCFIDTTDPSRGMDVLIREHCPKGVRIAAANCVDMLADPGQREQMACGAKVHWLTPGWIKHWGFIFKDWDSGKANEMFPMHSKAVVLDALGYLDQMMADAPERILEISDWMKLPIEAVDIMKIALPSIPRAMR